MSQHHRIIRNNRAKWDAVRLACFERDGFACTQCGATEALQADHVIELYTLEPDEAAVLAFDLDNLLTLCQPCNTKKHHDGAESGVIRNEWVNVGYPEVIDALAKFRCLSATPTTPAVV